MNTHLALSRALRSLHRELLEAVRREYEVLHGRVESPQELFRIVKEDQLFAWLQPLTDALVELDSALDDPEEPARLPAALARVEALLNGADARFSALYRHHLQVSPDVAVAHGVARSALTDVGSSAAA